MHSPASIRYKKSAHQSSNCASNIIDFLTALGYSVIRAVTSHGPHSFSIRKSDAMADLAMLLMVSYFWR